jgi:hypothetical protein
LTSPEEQNEIKEYSCELYRLAKFEPPNKWNVNNVFSSPIFVNEAEGNVAAAFVSFLTKYLGDELFYYLYRKIDSTSWETVLTTTLNLSLDETNRVFQEYGKSLENPPAVFSEHYSKVIPEDWQK